MISVTEDLNNRLGYSELYTITQSIILYLDIEKEG